MTTPGRFLERWSRRKREVPSDRHPAPAAPAETAAQTALDAAADIPAAAGGGTISADAGEGGSGAATDAMPPVDTLTLDADFSAFLKAGVSESLRRAALRKLFADPHFNRMDGLDIYIDDYSIADPIPPDVMERLRQFRTVVSDAPQAEPVDPVPGTASPQDDCGGEAERGEDTAGPLRAGGRSEPDDLDGA
jgi:hypothetical protein